jgi:hypothetical protein
MTVNDDNLRSCLVHILVVVAIIQVSECVSVETQETERAGQPILNSWSD